MPHSLIFCLVVSRFLPKWLVFFSVITAIASPILAYIAIGIYGGLILFSISIILFIISRIIKPTFDKVYIETYGPDLKPVFLIKKEILVDLISNIRGFPSHWLFSLDPVFRLVDKIEYFDENPYNADRTPYSPISDEDVYNIVRLKHFSEFGAIQRKDMVNTLRALKEIGRYADFLIIWQGMDDIMLDYPNMISIRASEIVRSSSRSSIGGSTNRNDNSVLITNHGQNYNDTSSNSHNCSSDNSSTDNCGGGGE